LGKYPELILMLESDITITCKYDTKGNWIEKIRSKTEANITLIIETKEIEYYE
jgi:hypothetical protein